MIPPSVAVLFAVAGCRFYQPTSAEVEDCEKLAALGYILVDRRSINYFQT